MVVPHTSDESTADGPSERIAGLSVRTWAYVLGLVTALAIADDLLRIPVQVTDALEEILAASRSDSLAHTFWQQTSNAAYLRPLRIVQIEALFKLAHGHYWLVYRGFHAALLVVAVVLFVRALRVRTRTDLVAGAFALTVLTGVHTFPSLIQEAFPINHFLEVAVFSLAALNLAQARGGWWVDMAALVLFCVAALTLESGLLVWVVAVGARIMGLRGVSRPALVAMTVLVAGYFVLRATMVGMPTLVERRSGYLFETLAPSEMIARFGHRLWWIRSYNVTTSALSVLLSEPRGGVFGLTRSVLDGHVLPGRAIAAASAALTTGLVAWCVLRARGTGGTSRGPGALPVLFTAVLGASAAMSYVYVKDDIMSTAGVFYALSAYAAVRWWAERQASMGRLGRAALTAALVIAATGWTIESLGVHYIARAAAFRTRNDWAVQPTQWKAQGRWPAVAAEQQLLGALRTEALAATTLNSYDRPRWMEDLWEP